MTTHSPTPGSLRTKVQAYIAAAYRGDLEEAATFLRDDVQLIMGGWGPLAGVHRGKSAFFQAFATMLSLTNGTYRLETELDWFENERRVVLLAIESAEVDGQRLRFSRAIVYEFAEDQVAEVRVYEADPVIAQRAFFG